MSSEAGGPALPSTCPTCGATVRSDVTWCTQCYTSLLAEPEQQPQPQRQPQGEPGTEVEDQVPPGARPGTTADPAEVERLAAQMLAELAGRPDGLHGLASHLPSTTATRALAVAVVIVVGSALVLLLMFLVGTAL
jgi:hypothetical protein